LITSQVEPQMRQSSTYSATRTLQRLSYVKGQK
jgi:hypothetical protein